MAFKLTDSPQALPGSCRFCGSSSRKFFIDTELYEDFHGRIYICVDECLREMVQLTGFITPEQAATNQARLREALELLERRDKTIQGMEQIINGYQLSFDDFLVDDPRADAPDVEPAPEPEKPVKKSTGRKQDSKAGSEAGEARTPESDSSGELAGIRPIAELPNLI